MLNTHYYRNNAANYIYKSAISPSSSSPHGGCSVLSTYYYRNNPANYIYKSAISLSSSSPHGGCSILNTHYYRNNPANYIYKSAISPSSSSPHGGCSILNTYYYRNNPANYIYKSAISSSSSSPHGICSVFVQPDPRLFPQAGEHSMLCFLHVHRRVLQSVMQLHLITRSRFSGAGPRNSFCLVVANFCYQVQDQVAKLIFW